MKKTTRLIFLISFCCMAVLSSGHALAASFDCAKARTKIEKMICGDAELSNLDEELGRAYSEARKKSPKPFSIKIQEYIWLKQRNKCSSLDCLTKIYQGRIDYLRSTVAPKEEQCVQPEIDWSNYQWYLIRGKGEPACEDMLAYLKSRPKDAPPPVCPEERLPSNKDWSRPEARFLNAEERKVIVAGIPKKYRQKPGDSGPVSYEWRFTDAAKMRVIHTDITRDGKPEYLLGVTDNSGSCSKVTRCDMDRGLYDKYILEQYGKGPFIDINAGQVDHYDLFPMTGDGKQVDWSHPTASGTPMLMNGELVYYKGKPFWLSSARWFQAEQDEPTHSLVNINDPYRAMFHLNGIGHSVIGQYGGSVKPAPFSQVQHIRGDGAICYYGYFRRETIEKFQREGN